MTLIQPNCHNGSIYFFLNRYYFWCIIRIPAIDFSKSKVYLQVEISVKVPRISLCGKNILRFQVLELDSELRINEEVVCIPCYFKSSIMDATVNEADQK